MLMLHWCCACVAINIRSRFPYLSILSRPAMCRYTYTQYTYAYIKTYIIIFCASTFRGRCRLSTAAAVRHSLCYVKGVNVWRRCFYFCWPEQFKFTGISSAEPLRQWFLRRLDRDRTKISHMLDAIKENLLPYHLSPEWSWGRAMLAHTVPQKGLIVTSRSSIIHGVHPSFRALTEKCPMKVHTKLCTL